MSKRNKTKQKAKREKQEEKAKRVAGVQGG
jgi:hypothetical protein